MSSELNAASSDSGSTSLEDLLNGKNTGNALKDVQDLIAREYKPCKRCPFLQRAHDVLLLASDYFDDNVSVVLADRVIYSVRTHLPAAILSRGREDYGKPRVLVLYRNQLLAECDHVVDLVRTKVPAIPLDLCKFYERLCIVYFLLDAWSESLDCTTEAITTALANKLPPVPSCVQLAMHLLAQMWRKDEPIQARMHREFSFFIKLAGASHGGGNLRLVRFCSQRAQACASSDAERAALEEIRRQIPNANL